jgi:hypothetical protein
MDVELGASNIVAVDGKAREATIGQYPAMTPEQARKEAKTTINQADTGIDPLQVREVKKQEALKLKEQTMRAYLAGAYNVYQASRKSGQQTLSILHNHFADWLDKPMTELKPSDVLTWQGKKMAEGLHFATMIRTYGALHGLTQSCSQVSSNCSQSTQRHIITKTCND